MQIRLATPDDIAPLNRLIPEAVRQLSAGFYSSEQVAAALEHIFGIDTQLISDGTYYVAEEGSTLVGGGGWSKRRTLFGGDQGKEGEDPLLDPATEAGRIRAFFVHPAWARRGIGRALLLRCEQAALADGFRRLELVATLPGEPLYRALGYRPVERLEILLAQEKTTLPAVHMEKHFEVRPS